MSTLLDAKYFDTLSQSTLNKLKTSMYRAVDLIEMFFPDPNDDTKKVKLGPYQKDLIDTIQFGYPLSQFKFGEVKEEVDGVIFISRRQVGKSWSCAFACGALMILGPTSIGHPPTRCGIIAASEEESKFMIDKVKEALENSDFNDFIIGRPKVDFIKLSNKSLTRSHTCSHKSIRGPSYHYAFLDESRYMDESILFSAAIPTTEHGERWIAFTTPQGSDGLLMESYIHGVTSRPVICKGCGENYKQKDFINAVFPDKNEIWKMPVLPGCLKCGHTSYKYGIGVFATPYLNARKCPIINQAKLERQLKAHGYSPWARQEWLGEVLDEASMVILNEWIVNNTNDALRNTMVRKPGLRYSMGVDYGRLHDACSICVTNRDKRTGRIVWDYMRTIAGEFDFDTDYDKIHKHVKKIAKFYNPFWLVLDSTGLGYAQVERVEKDLKRWGLTSRIYNSQKVTPNMPKEKRRLGYQITKQNKPDLIGNLLTQLSLVPHQLELPSRIEPEMDALALEMLKFECEVLDGGYIKYGTQNYHDDRLIAYALSLVGHIGNVKSRKAKTRGYNHDDMEQDIRSRKRQKGRRSRLIGDNYGNY